MEYVSKIFFGIAFAFVLIKSCPYDDDSETCENLSLDNFQNECLNGNIKNVKFLIKKVEFKYHTLLNDGLAGACQGGHMDIVHLMIEEGAYYWNMGLWFACYGGHMDIILFMIEKGAWDWNYGLEGACRGGHMGIVLFMIEKGATHLCICLKGACWGGHINIVNLMIEKGARNWAEGFSSACESGHTDIVNLMLEKGPSNLHEGFCRACYNGHMHIVHMMIKKGIKSPESIPDSQKERYYKYVTELEERKKVVCQLDINDCSCIVNDYLSSY